LPVPAALAPILPRPPAAAPAGRLALDCGRLDAALGGGLLLAGCHEIYGQGATALALMLVLALPRPGPILWISDGHGGGRGEDGRLYGAGISELGGDPARLWLVAAGGVVPMLRAAGEAQTCPALAAVVLESHGEARAIDLTVTRRLQLAAAAHGVFTLMLRGGPPRPSAALTRWQAQAAPTRRLAADAPGPPRLAITLARQRGGPADITCVLEWNRDRRRFVAAGQSAGQLVPIGAAPIGLAYARRRPAPPHPGAGAAAAAGRTAERGSVAA
jgi:protein ImuA